MFDTIPNLRRKFPGSYAAATLLLVLCLWNSTWASKRRRGAGWPRATQVAGHVGGSDGERRAEITRSAVGGFK